MVQRSDFQPEPLITILPMDRRFYDHDLQTEERETCSRCGDVIPEHMLPILAFEQNGLYQYRFHPACLGFQTFDEDDDDYDAWADYVEPEPPE